MNIKLDLINYTDLAEGETRSGECPVCGKRKFYVTRKQGQLAYICHRASCSLDPGYVGDSCRATLNRKYEPPRKQWLGQYLPITEDDLSYFDERFGINLYEDRGYWVKTTDDDRYAFPLYGRQEESRGVVIRQPTWGGYPPCHRQGTDGPKALSFMEDGAVKAGWYHAQDGYTVVIVEDSVSAMRVAGLGITAYALLGTYFSDDHFKDLLYWQESCGGELAVHLALDPDAIDKAMKITRRYRGGFKYWMLCNLKKDAKDYDTDEDLERDLLL